eukprot:TRINITY_DN8903_c0_g2_i1.p3 TRINITY_DN8903_c0_g2~~TRINITY_DN8903_c0_g2_i1.p3  ORF type:complete len:164 (+),score=78.13 TRINITY_DN8903_c0_g2_i1:63-554(+)
MSQLKAEVLMTTSNDNRQPGSHMVDGDTSSFWSTTGMYPQEVLIGFKDATVTLTKLKTWSHGVRKLVVQASCETQPINFKAVLELELAEKPVSTPLQQETFQVNSTVGASIRFLKLIIQSGWEDFATIHNLVFEGEVEAEPQAPTPSKANAAPSALDAIEPRS